MAWSLAFLLHLCQCLLTNFNFYLIKKEIIINNFKNRGVIMTKSSLSAALLFSAASSLSGCAVPLVGAALGTIGTTAAVGTASDAAKKEATDAVRNGAAPVTAPTTESNIKPASITWGEFKDKFLTNSGLAAVGRVATAVVWKSPDREFIKMTFKPFDKKSNIPSKVVTGEISAEACNRTVAGTVFSTASNTLGSIVRATERAAGLGGATNTPRNTSTVTAAMTGLTDEQKILCTAAIETLKSYIIETESKLKKEFETAYKGTRYTVSFEGTNGAEVVLGLNKTPSLTRR